MLYEGWTLELLCFWRNSLILKGCMLGTQTAAFPHLSCLLPHQIYSLWEYEFLSGPHPEKCISSCSFVVMGELLLPMGAFLWVTAHHLRCWDSPSQTVTAPAACWHLPVVAGVGLPPNPPAARWSICSCFRTPESSCKSALIALWELKTQNQSYKLAVRFLSLCTDTSLVTAVPIAAFEEIIPYLRIITLLRVLLFPFPKSSSCVISNTILWYCHAWVCYHCFLSPWTSQWFPGFAKPGEHSPSHPHLSWSKMPRQPWQMSSVAIESN